MNLLMMYIGEMRVNSLTLTKMMQGEKVLGITQTSMLHMEKVRENGDEGMKAEEERKVSDEDISIIHEEADTSFVFVGKDFQPRVKVKVEIYLRNYKKILIS